MKGMLVFTLRKAGSDCTLDGVSSKHDAFVLTGPGVPKVFEPDEYAPELVLDTTGGYLRAYPVDEPTGLVGPMFGGNFITSSDSRMREVNAYPIPVHDRYETQETYDLLSR